MSTLSSKWSSLLDNSRPGDGWDVYLRLSFYEFHEFEQFLNYLETVNYEFLLSFSIIRCCVIRDGHLDFESIPPWGHIRFRNDTDAMLFKLGYP